MVCIFWDFLTQNLLKIIEICAILMASASDSFISMLIKQPQYSKFDWCLAQGEGVCLIVARVVSSGVLPDVLIYKAMQ